MLEEERPTPAPEESETPREEAPRSSLGEKYCPHCGIKMDARHRFCPQCGCDTSVPLGSAPSATAPTADTFVRIERNRSIYETLTLLGFIFALVSTIIAGFMLLPLAWCIPFTIHIYNRMKRYEPMSMGVKICTLIFCNMIAGILLIVADSIYFERR